MTIAFVVIFRRPEVQVVNLSADRTTTPSGHALFQEFQRNVNENRAQLFSLPRGQSLEHFGLCRGPRKSVEDVTSTTILLRRPILDHANYQFVRDQLSRLLDYAHFFSQRALRLGQSAKHVASGNLRQPQALLQQARLRAFAGTRRAHQNDDLGHRELPIAEYQLPTGP